MQMVRISHGCQQIHFRWCITPLTAVLEPLQMERLQDWLHSGDEFSIAFKVNYMSDDLLPVTVTSRFVCVPDKIKQVLIQDKS